MSPALPPRYTKDDEKEKARFKGDLEAVGRNLPNDPVEVEGADVDHIVRHESDEDREEESEEEVIRETIKNPHPDADQETVDDLDL